MKNKINILFTASNSSGGSVNNNTKNGNLLDGMDFNTDGIKDKKNVSNKDLFNVKENPSVGNSNQNSSNNIFDLGDVFGKNVSPSN